MQKLKKLPLHNNSGSALILSVVFSAVFLIVGTGTMKLISRGNQMHTRDVKVIRSYWANESALRVALRYLTREIPHPDASIANFNTGFISINGYRPKVTITRTVTAGKPRYGISVTTKVDNMDNTTIIQQTSFNAFARYTWFSSKPVQVEENPVLWVGLKINGNYHSNGNLYLANNMILEEHVTGEATGAGDFDGTGLYPNPYDKGIMVSDWDYVPDPQPLEWFKPRIPNYRHVDPIDVGPLAPDSGAFDDGWIIENNTSNPGSYTEYFVQPYVSSGGAGNVNIYGMTKSGNTYYSRYLGNESINTILSSNKGIIKSSKPIHIAGEIKDQVTIVSDQDVYLAGHLSYHGVTMGQVPSMTATDMCGIVSGNDIIVQSNIPKYLVKSGTQLKKLDIPYVDWNSSEDQMHIYASLMSVNGCLKAEKLWDGGWGNNGENDLLIYGSNLVKAQGGTYNYSKWIKDNYVPDTFVGFVIDITGDPRFMNNIAAPPGLPDVRSADTEMREHHDVAFAWKFPIVVVDWKNSISK